MPTFAEPVPARPSAKSETRFTPSKPLLQAGFRLSAPGDPFEIEADRVANQVLRMPRGIFSSSSSSQRMPKPSLTSRSPLGGGVYRKCLQCENEDEPIFRKAETTAPNPGLAVTSEPILGNLRGGNPLDKQTRGFFESRFGHDFSAVRIHSNAAAAESARALHAHAYTTGSQIVFGAGQYQPQSSAGRHLLAHELAHVVQQGEDANAAKGWVQRSSVDNPPPLPQQGEGHPSISGEFPPELDPRGGAWGGRGGGQRGGGGGGNGGGGGASGEESPELCPPPGEMPCQTGPSPADYDMEFPFRVASAVMRPQDLRILDGLAVIWNMGPNSFALRIDGYASAEGGCVPNWNLSCERARAVVHRLAHPAYGTGIDAADLQSWAHGESDAAGPTLEANRRATLDIQIVDPTPADPETPAPIPSTPENCSPSRTQETATGCTPNPHGAHLPDVGGTHTESHAFEPCRLTQAEVAASPNWCVDSQQAHGGETCYREIPSVDSGPGDQYCYSENCCHNSRDAISVVSSTSPGSNSCCETNNWALPGHGVMDVLPEFIDDPERVMRDILGL